MSTSSSASSFALGLVVGIGLYSLLNTVARRRKCSKTMIPRRFGAAIKLKPEHYDRYTELHDAVWHDVLLRMSRSNIRNFTIYFHQETSTMFQHFEWIGHWGHEDLTDAEEKALFDADMEAIAKDPITKIWWTECEPCQEPFSQWTPGPLLPSLGGKGDWWAPLVCLNHCGHWATEYSSQLRDPDFPRRNAEGKTTVQPKI